MSSRICYENRWWVHSNPMYVLRTHSEALGRRPPAAEGSPRTDVADSLMPRGGGRVRRRPSREHSTTQREHGGTSGLAVRALAGHTASYTAAADEVICADTFCRLAGGYFSFPYMYEKLTVERKGGASKARRRRSIQTRSQRRRPSWQLPASQREHGEEDELAHGGGEEIPCLCRRSTYRVT